MDERTPNPALKETREFTLQFGKGRFVVWGRPHLPLLKHCHRHRLDVLAAPVKRRVPDPAPSHAPAALAGMLSPVTTSL